MTQPFTCRSLAVPMTTASLLAMATIATAAEPTCDLRLVGDGYSVCYEPGYAQDAELAREILDLAAQRLRVKYGPPDPFDLDVKLYTAPTGAVQAGRAYFDGRAIHYLTPSAPDRAGGTSSLGLPHNSTEFHYKTLTHEYFHAFHKARSSHSYGWAGWFHEALPEFEGIFGTAPYNGPELYDFLIEHVYERRRNRIFCCRTLQDSIETITTSDVYNAGAAILKFLEDQFGADIHVRLLTSRAATFEAALTDELASHAMTVPETFERLRAWLSETHRGTGATYTPSMACTGRYWQRPDGTFSFDVRILNNPRRPESHEIFQQQYRPAASRPWTTHTELSSVPRNGSGFSNPLFTGPASRPFQWRARSCPRQSQTIRTCSNWSNTIDWTAASCAARRIR